MGFPVSNAKDNVKDSIPIRILLEEGRLFDDDQQQFWESPIGRTYPKSERSGFVTKEPTPGAASETTGDSAC